MSSTRKKLSSIHTKIFTVVFLTCVAVVVAPMAYFSNRHTVAARASLENRARTYGELLARQLESAVAFDDRETAREAFTAIRVDQDVRWVALYVKQNDLLEERGDRPEGAVPLVAGITATDTIVRCIAPVISREGPRGNVVVDVSTVSVEAELDAMRRTALGTAALAVLVSSLAAWIIARYLARRLRVLADAAHRVASGALEDVSFVDASPDEIGQLASDLSTMVLRVRGLMTHIERTAAEENTRLDGLVKTLEARQRDMQMLLDHVDQGFLTVNAEGIVGPERSAILDRWFVPPHAAMSVWDYFATADPTLAEWFQLAWESLVEGNLPDDVAIEQFPRRLKVDNRIFELRVNPVRGSADEIVLALVVVTDITVRLEGERAEGAQREVHALVERALDDRAGVLDFLQEGSSLVDGITGDSLGAAEVARAIHTLKGNAGLFGLTSIADACHELETTLVEVGKLSSADRAGLGERWNHVAARLGAIVTKTSRKKLSIDRCEFDALIASIEDGASRGQIARAARLMRLEPLDNRLRQIGEQASALATRLGKTIEVEVEGCGLRFEGPLWASFWASFTHVVRNAVDHGIEQAAARAACGKRQVGRLALVGTIEEDRFILDVCDDGAGIAWDLVQRKAAAMGLAVDGPEGLADALFADGLSTRSEATDISGRGLGLAAVRAATAAFGGHVAVSSTRGCGTSIKFQFPIRALGDAYATTSDFDQRAVA